MCQSQWKWVNHTVFTCFYPVGNNNFLHNIGDICGIIDASTIWILKQGHKSAKGEYYKPYPQKRFFVFYVIGLSTFMSLVWQQKWHERVQPGFMDPRKYWPWITAMALQIKELVFDSNTTHKKDNDNHIMLYNNTTIFALHSSVHWSALQ